MFPNPDVELTPEQLVQLQQAQEIVPKLRAAINKAKTAGIKVDDLEARLADAEQSIIKLSRVYGSTSGLGG